MHLCRLNSEVLYARLENAFVRNFGHFAFVRTNTEMIAHKPSHRMAPDKNKNPLMIPNRANKKKKKRYAQGFSAFDTAETAADSKHGESFVLWTDYPAFFLTTSSTS
jgi:hypothetical protein